MKNFIYTCLLLCAMFLVSCSGDDYVNVIPRDSIALMAVDMKNVQKPEVKGKPTLEVLPFIADQFGVDLSEPVFLFETKDGNFGICAKVDDIDDVNKCITEVMVPQQMCKPLTKKKDFQFTVVKGSWALGLSDDALLIMGPAVAEQQPSLQQQMTKYLEADKEKGIKGTSLYEKLDSLNAPVRLVAQAQAFPENIAAPLTLGAPKDADDSQVIIAAELQAEDNLLMFRAHSFSFNQKINSAIQTSIASFRPVADSYLSSVDVDDAAAVLVNIEGNKLLEMIQANKGLQLLLAGINTAVDMDNIIRSVDGDAAFMLKDGDKHNVAMFAKLAKTDFLNDVPYWKQSAPKGMHIVDAGKDAYCVTGGESKFYFGVTADKQFYAGANDSIAKTVGAKAAQPLPNKVTDHMKGERLCIVANISHLFGNQAELVMNLIRPLFGSPEFIVYQLK